MSSQSWGEYARRHRWFLLLVALPVVISAFYYAFVASPEYVSESRFVIKSPGQRQASVTSIASLLQTTSIGSGAEQASEVVDFINSRSAVAALNARQQLSADYARDGVDFLSRYPEFWRNATAENLFKYYLTKTSAERDRDSGSVALRTTAFNPEDAQAINLRLLALSEGLVNRLNNQALQRGVQESEARVALAEGRVAKARSALAAYRSSHDVLDPTKQAGGALEIASRLITDRASLEAQLVLTQQAAPRNPAIPALRTRIAAIDAQIAGQNGRAVGGDGAFAGKASAYDALDQEQQFAAQNLVATSAALEGARAEAVRQQYYLERIVEPMRPDYPELPHGWRSVLTLAAGLLCLYFVGWMFVVGVVEHGSDE